MTEEPSSVGTLSFFFREAFRRLWVSKRTSIVAVGMITMSLSILGAFLLVAENLARAAGEWEQQAKVTIYLNPRADAATIRGVENHLAIRTQFVSRKFVSREEAAKRFKAYFKNLSGVIDDLGRNPFPASFEITLPARANEAAIRTEIAALTKLPGVDEVHFDTDWIVRLRHIVSLLNIVGLVAGGILAIAAAFTIANVIRLTMFLYREEIDIMRLVGATETMIRGPFLIEGLLQGTIGALLAVGLLYGGFFFSRQGVANSNTVLWQFLFATFLPWPKVAALIGGGISAGLIGSWISVRETHEEPAQAQ